MLNKTTEQRYFAQASRYFFRIRVELIIDDEIYRIQVKFSPIYGDLLTLTNEKNVNKLRYLFQHLP